MSEERSNEYWLTRVKEPLSNLDLSDTVLNELHARGLRTIEHLLMHSEVEIYKVISRCKKVIMDEIRNQNLPMGMRIENADYYEYIPPEETEEVLENRSLYKHIETRPLEQVLESLADAVFSVLPSLSNNLNPPASGAEIEKLQNTFDMPLPEELRTLLTFANGATNRFLPHSFELLSIDEMIAWRKMLMEIVEENPDIYNIMNKDYIVEGIQITAFHKDWIPFASVDRNALFIDMVPTDKGIKGQIITSDLSYTKWLTKDLVQFFGQLDAGIMAGWYYPTEEGDYPALLSRGVAWFNIADND